MSIYQHFETRHHFFRACLLCVLALGLMSCESQTLEEQTASAETQPLVQSDILGGGMIGLNTNLEDEFDSKDVALASWIEDIIILAEGPKLDESSSVDSLLHVDVQSKDIMWALTSSQALASRYGRYSNSPYENKRFAEIRELYALIENIDDEHYQRLVALSGSDELTTSIWALNALAIYNKVSGNIDAFYQNVFLFIELQPEIPYNLKNKYDFLLNLRLQEKAILSRDLPSTLKHSRNVMALSYEIGLGKMPASTLFNPVLVLVSHEKYNDAIRVAEAMVKSIDKNDLNERLLSEFALAIAKAKVLDHQDAAVGFDNLLPLAQTIDDKYWIISVLEHSAREYALAGDFNQARDIQASIVTLGKSNPRYSDLIDFEEAIATGNARQAGVSAKAIIETRDKRLRDLASASFWSQAKMQQNVSDKSAQLEKELYASQALRDQTYSSLSTWKLLAGLAVTLLLGTLGALGFILARARALSTKSARSTIELLETESALKAAQEHSTSLSKLLDAAADEISRRVSPSLTLIDFASRSSEDNDLPFANEAKAALRSFSVLSLDLAAIAGGKLPKPVFKTIESANLEKLLRRRLRDHMDGDASCNIKVNVADNVPPTMVMDCDRVLHVVMCMVAGAWKRSHPAPVVVEFGFDRFKGVLQVNVIDVGGIVPANIEDEFSTLPSDPSADTEQMLLRMQYAAADKLVEAMGGQMDFDGSHASHSGYGLRATALMPVVRQTSEEGDPSYVVAAPGCDVIA